MHGSREAEAAARSGTSTRSSSGRALTETEEGPWAAAVEEPGRQGEVHALRAVGAGEPRSILRGGITGQRGPAEQPWDDSKHLGPGLGSSLSRGDFY